MYNEAGWLAEDAHALQNALPANPATPEGFDCDVLIVGSGYGGAVAAARLAGLNDGTGRPLKVWVVERGREYLPGMFPSRTGELAGHVRLSGQNGEAPRGNDTALFDLRMGRDVNVVLASGLGGGSLINAAVMERPEPSVWHGGWPAGIDGERLESDYAKVIHMLQAKVPMQTFPKFRGLQHMVDGLPDRPTVERCRIAVAFEATTTEAGVRQEACTACGDCATGCNWQAKNSLDVNYLALAYRGGAELFCGVLAQRIERRETGAGGQAAGWVLHWTPMERSLKWGGTARPIRAHRLIVCAGSLGSTELLQRSQTEQLRFSKKLGSAFSTNGDMIAAAVDLPIRTNICGDETTPGKPDAGQPGRNVGPTITGMLRHGEGSRRFTLQEFSIPAALRPLLAEATGSVGMLQSLAQFDGSLHRPGERREDPLAPGDAAIDRTMVYGLMGDDGAGGTLELVGRADAPANWDGRIAVQWPEVRSHVLFKAQHDALYAAYTSRFFPNPLWRPLPKPLERLVGSENARGPVTTVHPLGGCPMGDSAVEGVVDHAGRVFDGSDAARIGASHVGLVVLDGAIVPRALGINPALTIAALAEHAMPTLIGDWNLRQPFELPSRQLRAREHWRTPPQRPRTETTAIRLREQQVGSLSFEGQRYWAELEVSFAPIRDVVAFTRNLPRIAPIERAVLRLYPDRGDREDEPQWREHRDVQVKPRWTVELGGEVHVLYRRWSWWPGRLWRGLRATLRQPSGGVSLGGVKRLIVDLWRKAGGGASGRDFWRGISGIGEMIWSSFAIASHLGERRGFDYHLQVGVPATDDCPLKTGDRLRGRKLLDCTTGSNPWRQVSEMTMAWGPLTRWHTRWRNAGRLAIDLRYLVNRNSALVELHAQSDHATALADVGGFAMLCLKAMLKIQLMSFIPPARPKTTRDRSRRLPGELPGLSLERFDLQRTDNVKALLTRYWSTDWLPLGRPVLLIHGYSASGSTFAHPSMEPNLVQQLCMQRREVWVVELRTSIAFEKADGSDWSFEEVADELPTIIRAVRDKSDARRGVSDCGPSSAGAERVDVVAHCIGAAMFCRAALRDATLHTSIGAVVLSQVGPLVRMAPGNLLRGFFASYLAQYLGATTLDAAPDPAEMANGGLGTTLVDVLLASMPYLDGDLDRKEGRATKAAGRPDFRLVRHRIDAMLGRVMELSEDSPTAPATLDALDDIFGFVRTKTLAQVIHYARLSMLVDSDGRNREICNGSLSDRMPFPVLLLHGRRSGVFDWRGSLQSYEWLRSTYGRPEQLTAAVVERDADRLHLGLNTPRQLCVFDKLGHQDSVIGTRAPNLVFPVISKFLQPAMPPSQNGTDPKPHWVAELPWVGPVVGWLRPWTGVRGGSFEASLLLRPSPLHATTRMLVLVPMLRQGGRWQHDTDEANYRYWSDLSEQPVPMEDTGQYVDYIQGRLIEGAVTLQVDREMLDGSNHALLILALYDDIPPQPPPREVRPDPQPFRQQALQAVRRFLAKANHGIDGRLLRLGPHIVKTADLPRASRASSLTLAVASCQYPHGLLDRALAGKSYERLAARLDAPEPAPAGTPQLLLLLGDQVYVDETAGVFDPSPIGGALDHTYDRAFRLPAFRAVTSRLPTYMLLDDHEVANGWQPPPEDEAQALSLMKYRQLQASSNPQSIYPTSFSFRSAPGGWPLFVLDTRSGRQPRTPEDFHDANIVPDIVMRRLKRWLLRQSSASLLCPKFIAMASVLLPLERDAGQPRWSSDGWAGYPASRADLLGFIAEHQIRNVVFLAGDPHLSMVSKLVLHGRSEPPIAVYSVVSSGLYAPWLFSNADESDFQLDGPVWLNRNASSEFTPQGPPDGTIVSIVEPRNGFAVVTVRDQGPQGFVLEVEFDTDARRRRITQSLADPRGDWTDQKLTPTEPRR